LHRFTSHIIIIFKKLKGGEPVGPIAGMEVIFFLVKTVESRKITIKQGSHFRITVPSEWSYSGTYINFAVYILPKSYVEP